MKKSIITAASALLLLGTFLAGSWYQKQRLSGNPSAGGRQILYYVDPMHPSYKSDKPGIAPDCGMKLEPVYADGGGPATGAIRRSGIGGSGHGADQRRPTAVDRRQGGNR